MNVGRLTASSSLRLLPAKVLTCSSRNTWFVKRRIPVLDKYKRPTWISPYIVGDYVKDLNDQPDYPETYDLYDHEVSRRTDFDPKPPVRVILLENIDGLGGIGDVIECQADIARFNVILSRKGVYACDFNLKYYKKLIEGSSSDLKPSSILSPFTKRQLMQSVFTIFVSDKNPWLIEKRHVLAAFRLNGLSAPPEAIELPSREIKGPELSNQYKTFIVHVTINNKERVPTKCMIVHLNQPLKLEYYAGKLEPLFEEDRQLLDSLPIIERTTDETEDVSFD